MIEPVLAWRWWIFNLVTAVIPILGLAVDYLRTTDLFPPKYVAALGLIAVIGNGYKAYRDRYPLPEAKP